MKRHNFQLIIRVVQCNFVLNAKGCFRVCANAHNYLQLFKEMCFFLGTNNRIIYPAQFTILLSITLKLFKYYTFRLNHPVIPIYTLKSNEVPILKIQMLNCAKLTCTLNVIALYIWTAVHPKLCRCFIISFNAYL